MESTIMPEWHSAAYFRIQEKRKKEKVNKKRMLIAAAITMVVLLVGFLIGFTVGRYCGKNDTNVDPAKTADASHTGVYVIINQPSPRYPAVSEEASGQLYDLTEQEEYLLAKLAMAEAEGEDTAGKALVILTVLNRVVDSQFPDGIQEVITQKNAFTSYSNGRFDRVEPDEDCWAALGLVENGWDDSEGALYFEAKEPGEGTWHSENLRELFVHGRHTFYTEM